MSKVDEAISCYKEGYNCSQAIFATYALDFGIDREHALRLSAVFGGGLGRTGKTCGAVSGALMIIGLHYGSVRPDPVEKEKTYTLVRQFISRFEEKHKYTYCTDLLGCNLSTHEGKKEAKEQGVLKSVCPNLIKSAAETLEEML